MIRQVEFIARPKAVYRVSYIESRGLNKVTIEDVTFHNQGLRKNLESVGRVFLFVATCGSEVDEIPTNKDDILIEYWLNTIKLELLQAGIDHLRETLSNRFGTKYLSSMNPGSGDASLWPIEEQRLLFSLLVVFKLSKGILAYVYYLPI